MPGAGDNVFILLLLSSLGAFLLMVSFVIIQAKNQNRLLRQKKKLDEAEIQHQKELLHSVIRSQEDDRKRIGQNLHDDVGGDLAVLKMLISGAPGIASSQPLIEKIVETVRTISHDLSPQMMNFLGLCEVLDDLCEKLSQGGVIKANFICSKEARAHLWPEEDALAIYRVLQELIANTLKHAGASSLHLSLSKEGNLMILDYSDDGCGIIPGTKKGMGTANMVSRLEMLGAQWQINSLPGSGYSNRIVIPIYRVPLS